MIGEASPTGRLRLRAVRLGGRTVLAEVERSAPFHPGPPNYRAGDGTAEVIVQQSGPGLFPGETLLVEVEVEAGARLIVRGQGATKVYPSPTGDAARVTTRLRVAAGGDLVWLPGELIPFRAATLRQETEVGLEAGARLALAELLTPGRVAMGERDAYERLDLRLRLRIDGRVALVERALLEPGRRRPTAIGRHGGFGCAGALYLAGFGGGAAAPDQGGWVEAVWWGSGHDAATDLVVVRALGGTAQAVRDRLDDVRRQTERNAGPMPAGP